MKKLQVVVFTEIYVLDCFSGGSSVLVAWQPHSEHKTPGEFQQERENTDKMYFTICLT